ncbi:thioredoxin family protein [Arthrobacter sp. H14]|uniref:thioredoxin family protein n=1 Tax=Arthrobacter sp. H14 TaxID=1312959 RepID=UPI0009DE4DE7
MLLDFWQASCAPCLAHEPILEQFSATHPGLFEGYRIDIDTQHDLVERYHVTSIPTIPDEGVRVRVRVPCFDLGGRRRALTSSGTRTR